MLPYPEPSKAISQNGAYGGALAPAQAFYESYPAGDLRTAEKGYYYTEHEAQDGSGVVGWALPSSTSTGTPAPPKRASRA